MAKTRPRPDETQIARLALIEAHPAEYVLGVDEVGFGAWAGPLVVGGVVLPKGWDHPLCLDSKVLSAKQRVKALAALKDSWVTAIVCGMEANDVDKIGVNYAREYLTKLVTKALLQIVPDSLVVQDGGDPISSEGVERRNLVCMVGADAHVPAVSAASIVAKLTRDEDMVSYGEVFPEYAFHSNKGYHSAAHNNGLAAHGPCAIHRMSYKPLKKFVVGSKPWQSRPQKRETHVWTSFPRR